jgi:hypothetical protein
MVAISPGELIDKVTILRIKQERITGPNKLINVKRELEMLTVVMDSFADDDPKIRELADELQKVNEEIWDFEDIVREGERTQTFGDEFLATARGIYKANDQRSRLKRELNELLESEIIEEKSYAEYE